MSRPMQRPTIPRDEWQRIIRVIDEAYAEYLRGMKLLRKQVVADVERRVGTSKPARRRAR